MGLAQRILNRFGIQSASQVAALNAKLTETSQLAAAATREVLRLRTAHASGVKISGGAYGYELNPDLRGGLRWAKLEEMQHDPHIKGALRFNTLPLLTAEWNVVPASDKSRDIEIAEFVSANLLCESSDRFGRDFWMANSWHQFLFESLDMLSSGFSMFGKSMKRVGSKVVYDRLTWFEPSSVDPQGWVLDDQDNIVSVKRTYQTARQLYRIREEVPADSIALFVYELKGARYEGCPFLRSMWGAHFRKDLYQKWGLAWAQKVGAGAPMAFYPADSGYDEGTSSHTALVEFVQQLRGMAPTESFFVGPMGRDGTPPDIRYATSELMQLDRMRGLIRGENDEIGQSGGNTGMQTNAQPFGSKAKVQTITSIELMFLGATAVGISSYLNAGCANLTGLVPELVDRNFLGVREYPRIECARVHPEQGLENMADVREHVKAGIIPMVPELRRQVTERYGFKLPEDAYDAAPVPMKDPDEDPDEDPEEPEEPEDVAADAMTTRDRIRDRMAPWMEPATEGPPAGKMGRRPNKYEQKYCALAAVLKSFDDGDKMARGVLREVRTKASRIIAARIRKGKIEARNIESQARSKPPSWLDDRMVEVLMDVAGEGREHVRDELRRMAGE